VNRETYPHTPGAKERGATSEEAAVRMHGTAHVVREEVLNALQAQPMTADEVATAIDRSVLSVRPRVSELKRLGTIEKTGERRTNESGMAAHVWRLRAN